MSTEVTICVLTYNRPHLLVEAVQSILSQTWRDLKIVILDNASPVDYREARRILNDTRIEYHRHEHSLGSWGNFRYACEHYGKSPFVMFFHDDDIMHPELIARQIAIMHQRPDVAWVSCCLLPFIGTVPALPAVSDKVDTFRDPGSLAEAIMCGLCPSYGAVLYRGAAISRIELDELGSKYSIIADRPVLFRAMGPFSAAVLASPFVLYRVHPAQDSRTGPLRAPHLVALAAEFRRVMTPWRSPGVALRFGVWCAFNLPDSYFRLPAAERPALFSFLTMCARSRVLSWWLLPWFPMRRVLGTAQRTLRRLLGSKR